MGGDQCDIRMRWWKALQAGKNFALTQSHVVIGRISAEGRPKANF